VCLWAGKIVSRKGNKVLGKMQVLQLSRGLCLCVFCVSVCVSGAGAGGVELEGLGTLMDVTPIDITPISQLFADVTGAGGRVGRGGGWRGQGGREGGRCRGPWQPQ